MFLEISQNSQESTCARVSFLIKLQLNFVKLLITLFLIEHVWWLLLNKLGGWNKINTLIQPAPKLLKPKILAGYSTDNYKFVLQLVKKFKYTVHSVHWGINPPPSKTTAPSFLPSPSPPVP